MGNTALITGASSGIGKELAHIHAENGGDLVLVARREEALNQLKTDLEGRHSVSVHVMAKDLTQTKAAKELFTAIQSDGIDIDVLINNAGFGGHGKFHERDWAQELSMIQLNIIALTELCHLFIPQFIERGSGKILNVSSTASLPPGGPLQSVYFATKHYVTAFSNGIAEELADTPITVTNLMPGATETEFANTSGMDKTDLFANTVTARSVAEEGYRAMRAGKLDIVSGLTFTQKLMMASIPFVPKRMILGQIKQMQELKG